MVSLSLSESGRALLQRALAGEARAVGRVLRNVDERAPGYLSLLSALHPRTGHAYVLGVTGTPGAGKSTLVDQLVGRYRARGARVGVLAVDPSSPHSGGSILGDRIRMQRHALDAGVFVRSLSTRGHLGGLSRSANDLVHVLDALGCDVVVLETVGVGQDELDVARHAHTTVVVLTPGGGDDVQAQKAGVLEVADVFVINKADLPGADAAAAHLGGMLALSHEASGAPAGGHGFAYDDAGAAALDRSDDAPDPRWTPPVLKAEAARGAGIDALLEACDRHWQHLRDSTQGHARLAALRRADFLALFRERLWEGMERRHAAALERCAARVAEEGADPYSTVEELLREVEGDEPG